MGGAKRQKKAPLSGNTRKEGSNEEVLLFDVDSLRQSRQHEVSSNEVSNVNVEALPERFSEVDVEISSLSSTGDGIGTSEGSPHVYVVPFTIAGDKAKAKIFNQFEKKHYSLTDLVRIIRPSPQRNDALIGCKYFGTCGGCQLQMLPYDDQLQHKKQIIEKAYRNFSALAPEAVPAVRDTIGSPKQYGYRTKLTPHFDGPPRSKIKEAKRTGQSVFQSVPPMGFMMKGSRRTLDIEDCPIGTDAVREGMKTERKRVAEEIGKYMKGATLLLRESTTRESCAVNGSSSADVGQNDSEKAAVPFIESRTCITDSNAMATEYVNDFVFENTAGSFFQNNNSVLPSFTDYIRSHIIPPNSQGGTAIEHLVDAYCGSGLFTVTLSSLFTSSIGIDIAPSSITAAKKNAELNNVKNATFMTADAAALFEKIKFPADRAAVVIDPPRKGCDEAFLKQLLAFGPKRVVYVSCNVHTQARDVGFLVEGLGGPRYEIESLQGFDFFPQTGHVEGVAILQRCGKADREE